MGTQQILDLVSRWSQAELTGDVAAYDDLLTGDFTGIGPVGFVLDREQWAGRHRGGLTNHEFEIVDPQVRAYGDAAIVSGVQRQRATARGHDASGSFRLTLVAVRQGDRWVIANIQLSGPLQAPSAPPPFRPSAPEPASRADVRAAVDAGTAVVVDALPAPVYDRRHLPTARNLTIEDAPAAAAAVLPDRAAPVIVYSTDTACTRAPELADDLRSRGYENVRVYTGGIEDWIAAGLPVEP
jgi:rhodanese-related sulfurtransferase/ketosteroid isomerase-like protein